MKTACLFLVALVAVALLPFSASGDAVDIQPSVSDVGLGSNCVVNIQIFDATDLSAFQFDVTFDPSILAAGGIVEGTLLPSGGPTFFIAGVIDNVAGSISFTADTLLGLGVGVDGDGTLASITFTAIGNGNSSLDLSNVILLDSAGAEINTSTQDGAVAVTPTPEPSSLVLAGVGLLVLAFLPRTRRFVPGH